MMIHLPLANITSFIKAYDHSDVFGKLVILALVGMSLVCWLLLIQKIWVTKQVVQTSAEFKRAYVENKDKLFHLQVEDLPRSKHKQVPHPFADIFQELKVKTVEILNKNLYFVSERTGTSNEQVHLSWEDLSALESQGLSTIASQAKGLEKNLFVLSTIVTLAPFLGLLGTVWGILISFSELGAGSAASNMAVLGGLSTALATTVLGLVIAIPALVAHAYLKSEIKRYTTDMEEFLYQLLFSVELQYRKVDMR